VRTPGGALRVCTSKCVVGAAAEATSKEVVAGQVVHTGDESKPLTECLRWEQDVHQLLDGIVGFLLAGGMLVQVAVLVRRASDSPAALGLDLIR
jgi:hypothetical protein